MFPPPKSWIRRCTGPNLIKRRHVLVVAPQLSVMISLISSNKILVEAWMCRCTEKGGDGSRPYLLRIRYVGLQLNGLLLGVVVTVI